MLQAAAQQGATAPPAEEEALNIDLHYVALVCQGGTLWELDGRKSQPINHGPTVPERLLQDAVEVVRREFVERTESINFNLIALAAAGGDNW
jgi:ubiquitin carboxyl-terminal hydrolase L3